MQNGESVRKSGKRCIAWLVLYKIVVDFTFLTVCTPMYAYIGGNADPQLKKYIGSWILFILLLMVYRMSKVEKEYNFLIVLLMILSTIPSLAICWVKNEKTIVMLLTFVYYFIFMLTIYVLTRIKNDDRCFVCETVVSKDAIINILFVWGVITTILFSYKYGNMRVFVRFEDVYTYRLTTKQMSAVESYIFSWNKIVILPLLLCWYIEKKKIIQSLILILMFFLCYSIYGEKTVVFLMAAVIGVNVIKKMKKMDRIVELLISFLIVCLLLACGLGMKTNWITGILYRLIYIPAEAHYYYYDFFQSNPLLLLRQSVGRFFANDPYPTVVSILIGSNVKYNLTGDYNNLNNGLISDAYANFGILGIMIYPVIIAVVYYILGRSMKKMPITIKYVIIITETFYLMSGSFFAWLLSGGVFVSILICSMMSCKNIVKTKNVQ